MSAFMGRHVGALQEKSIGNEGRKINKCLFYNAISKTLSLLMFMVSFFDWLL